MHGSTKTCRICLLIPEIGYVTKSCKLQSEARPTRDEGITMETILIAAGTKVQAASAQATLVEVLIALILTIF